MRSVRTILLLIALLCCAQLLHAQGYRLIAPTPSSVDSLTNQPGVTLSQILDTLHAHLDPADTNEGGALDDWETFRKFWQARVTVNDSSGNNMFRQYYRALQEAVLAGEDTPCSGSPGVYIYQASDDKGIIKIGKLVVVK